MLSYVFAVVVRPLHGPLGKQKTDKEGDGDLNT